MGLSLLNVISKSNFRICKPKLLSSYILRHKELQCTRFMSNYLQKLPTDTSKKVSDLFFIFNFCLFLTSVTFLNKVMFKGDFFKCLVCIINLFSV